MAHGYYISVYWGTRKENALSCAYRASGFLDSLKNCDPLFSKWFKRGRTRKKALQKTIEINAEYLQDLFLKEGNQTKLEDDNSNDLGFHIGLWTGGKNDASASLNIQCGCYASIPGINSCVLELPTNNFILERLSNIRVLTSIMKCMVISWEPTWGVVNSYNLQNIFQSISLEKPHIGWMLFLSNDYGEIPTLPYPSQVMSLGNHGSLIIVVNERFMDSNIRHIETINQVEKILVQAGLISHRIS